MNKYTNEMMGCEQHLFLDDRLSLKAKGLYCVLMSIEKPFTMKDIKECTTSGMTIIQTAFNELQEKGFIKARIVRVNGRYAGYSFQLSKPKGE